MRIIYDHEKTLGATRLVFDHKYRLSNRNEKYYEIYVSIFCPYQKVITYYSIAKNSQCNPKIHKIIKLDGMSIYKTQIQRFIIVKVMQIIK